MAYVNLQHICRFQKLIFSSERPGLSFLFGREEGDVWSGFIRDLVAVVSDGLKEEGVMSVSVKVEVWVGGCEAARGEDCVLVGSVDAVKFWRASGGG